MDDSVIKIWNELGGYCSNRPTLQECERDSSCVWKNKGCLHKQLDRELLKSCRSIEDEKERDQCESEILSAYAASRKPLREVEREYYWEPNVMDVIVGYALPHHSNLRPNLLYYFENCSLPFKKKIVPMLNVNEYAIEYLSKNTKYADINLLMYNPSQLTPEFVEKLLKKTNGFSLWSEHIKNNQHINLKAIDTVVRNNPAQNLQKAITLLLQERGGNTVLIGELIKFWIGNYGDYVECEFIVNSGLDALITSDPFLWVNLVHSEWKCVSHVLHRLSSVFTIEMFKKQFETKNMMDEKALEFVNWRDIEINTDTIDIVKKILDQYDIRNYFPQLVGTNKRSDKRKTLRLLQEYKDNFGSDEYINMLIMLVPESKALLKPLISNYLPEGVMESEDLVNSLCDFWWNENIFKEFIKDPERIRILSNVVKNNDRLSNLYGVCDFYEKRGDIKIFFDNMEWDSLVDNLSFRGYYEFMKNIVLKYGNAVASMIDFEMLFGMHSKPGVDDFIMFLDGGVDILEFVEIDIFEILVEYPHDFKLLKYFTTRVCARDDEHKEHLKNELLGNSGILYNVTSKNHVDYILLLSKYFPNLMKIQMLSRVYSDFQIDCLIELYKKFGQKVVELIDWTEMCKITSKKHLSFLIHLTKQYKDTVLVKDSNEYDGILNMYDWDSISRITNDYALDFVKFLLKEYDGTFERIHMDVFSEIFNDDHLTFLKRLFDEHDDMFINWGGMCNIQTKYHPHILLEMISNVGILQNLNWTQLCNVKNSFRLQFLIRLEKKYSIVEHIDWTVFSLMYDDAHLEFLNHLIKKYPNLDLIGRLNLTNFSVLISKSHSLTLSEFIKHRESEDLANHAQVSEAMLGLNWNKLSDIKNPFNLHFLKAMLLDQHRKSIVISLLNWKILLSTESTYSNSELLFVTNLMKTFDAQNTEFIDWILTRNNSTFIFLFDSYFILELYKPVSRRRSV
jgi:hypothetical protein